MKLLALDIETAPTLCYTFSLWNANIGHKQIVEDPRMICVSAQWVGSKKTLFFSEYHDGRQVMLDELHALLDEADAVITYNGANFDLPWITGEFLAEGMKPPSPYKSIDLFRTLKQSSRWPSRKLDYAAQRLLDDRKVEHSGFQLWIDCIGENVDEKTREKGWAKMRKYAKHDTALLLPLYEILKPFIKQHPIVALHDNGTELSCPVCGGKNFTRRGYSVTSAGKFPRYQCQDDGKWFRGAKREATTEARNIP